MLVAFPDMLGTIKHFDIVVVTWLCFLFHYAKCGRLELIVMKGLYPLLASFTELDLAGPFGLEDL